MKKGFTLIELMVVVGIMGLLGTVSVGGYKAMQRGMEEKGVMQNVNSLVKTAFERAQIDRSPTAIFFWNETLREESTSRDETIVVVGRAVAVRQQGRISLVTGSKLIDEYADLNLMFPKGTSEDSSSSAADGGAVERGNEMYLYCLDELASGNKPKRSVVSAKIVPHTFTEIFMHLGDPPNDTVGNGRTETWGFELVDKGGANWKVGSAYGMEFAELTLPKNYIFGSSYSSSVNNPVVDVDTLVFKVGVSTGSGGIVGGASGNISVYSIRPGSSGQLQAQKVATSDTPY